MSPDTTSAQWPSYYVVLWYMTIMSLCVNVHVASGSEYEEDESSGGEGGGEEGKKRRRRKQMKRRGV